MYVESKILTHFQASQIEGLVGSHQQKKWVIQKIGRENLKAIDGIWQKNPDTVCCKKA